MSARWGKVQVGIAVLFLISTSLSAQISTGTISGAVSDATGGVVPGTTITIQNVDTGFTRTITTDDSGLYRAPAVPVGNYTIRFVKDGFQAQTRQGLVLTVSQEMVVNTALTVGTAAQEVTVTSEAPQVNTTNAQLGSVVNVQQMAELPLNGRNWNDLTLLEPGVTRLPSMSATNVSRGMAFSVNGAPTRSNNYLLDGAPLQDMGGFNASSVGDTQLGMDGIREFKLVTHNFGAEYGQVMGSQMIMVSKSGTNQWHGGAFDYLRNAAMDARNFFDFSYQVTGKRTPQYQRNQFGGSFGGPIRKDKTFFYAVYEGLREKKGLPFLQISIAPGCRGAAGTVLTNATCPQLQLPTSTPSVTISSVTARILPLYPIPNQSGNAYAFTFVQPVSDDYGQLRIDHTFSAADLLFGRYTIDSGQRTSVGGGFGEFTEPSSNRNQYATLSETHIFSPTLLNTARLTYSRTIAGSKDFNPINSLVGDPSLSFQPAEQASRGVLTEIGQVSIQGGINQLGIGTTGGPYSFLGQNLYTVGDDLFITKGKHALKIGALIVRYEQTTGSVFQVAGSATFASLSTFMTNQLASFTVSTAGFDNQRYYRYLTAGMYVQDDWHASNRLMLNMGLRYEFRTTPVEASGKQYSVRNTFTDATPTKGPEFQNPSLKNFSPRFGFAYDLTGTGKTSVRGGFGIYYEVAGLGGYIRQQSRGMPPLGGTLQVLKVPLTIPFVFPTGIPASKNFNEPDYYMKQPYLMQWGLSVDRQLPAGMAATIAYVGTHGVNIPVLQEGNPCVPTSIDASGPLWATPCGTGRINPNWGTVTLNTNQAYTSYNALQIIISKQVGRGLSFQGNYTWSKNEDTGNGQWPTDRSATRFYVALNGDASYNKAVSSFDVTNSARLNVLYHFQDPSFKSSFAKVANGWWMGNIFTVRSGVPFTPVTSSGSRSQSSDSTSTDIVDRAPSYNAATVITGNIDQWFNPSMFQIQPLGRLGNAGPNSLRGPGLFNWDFSINKDTKLGVLGDTGMLQFRAELFNILNHPNFDLPTAAVLTGTGAVNPNAGRITSTAQGTSSRDVQLALRLVF